jgi:hypothetical protein
MPSGTFSQISLSGLGSHACGIQSPANTVICWGQNNNGQTNVYQAELGPIADGTTFGQVSVGSEDTCGILTTDSTVVCWGTADSVGALDKGQNDASWGTFAQVSAGNLFNCGVRTDESLACWGDNSQGQSSPPIQNFAPSVSAQFQHTCGIQPDGSIQCWGDPYAGQTAAQAGTFTKVDVGITHNVALRTNGTLKSWGRNEHNVVWGGPGGAFTDVSGSRFYSCAIRADGILVCWGHTIAGATRPYVSQGGPVANNTTFIQVSTATGGFNGSENYACGIKTDQTLVCWGSNAYGKASPPTGTFTQIDLDANNGCGLRTDGTLACWGQNAYGSLNVPSGTFVMVDAGHQYGCALGIDDKIVCWGRNFVGQSSPPSGISDTFTHVSAGDFYACGVRTDSTTTCWGWNSLGRAVPPAPSALS